MSETSEIDLVTAEVIRSAMETVCFEMATYVSRTATTPILNQSNERNATILDAEGRLAALSVGIPQFMLSSTLPVRFAIDFFGDELKPGDVIVANDPYHGGGHLPDFNVFAPVFDDDGELLLVASIQCHHGDTGGAVPGGYNTMAKDVYSEGTRYPLLKIIDGGHERRDVILTMRANNRLAGFIGDLRSQVGAAQLGATRLQELAAHWGADTVRAAVTHTIDDARSRFSEEIRGWPDGTYEADIYVDSDPQGNQDLHVHIAVTVDGDRLILDFEGSDTRPNISGWSTFGNTRGNAIAQLASLVDPSIPKNEGFFDCVELRVPLGCCLNPVEPKPVSSGTHHPGVEVGDAIAVAMAQIIPERCAPQTYKFGSPRQMWGEVDPRTGQSFFDHGGEVSAGWVNGVDGVDGWGALAPAMGNLIKASAELNERLFPHILRGRNYLTDSGGPGKFRGGCGSHFVKEARTPTSISQYCVNQRHIHPGIAGGLPGSPDICFVSKGTEREVRVSPVVTAHLLETGDQLVYDFGGGGGWGDPLERDVEAVLDDVWDEYVSVEGAHRDYGVVITGTLEAMDLAIDYEATKQLRCGPVRGGGGMSSDRYRIGVDVGGTFTDCVLLRPDGSIILEKTPTTPEDQSDGVLAGIARLAEAENLADAAALLGQTASIVHGTTAADNSMIQMTGAPDRPARHRGLPRRDRDAALLQGGHLGPELPGPRAHRPPPGPARGRRARHRVRARSTASSTRRACARRRPGCGPSASRRSPSASCTAT